MTKLSLTIAEPKLRKVLLFAIVFVGLNILDAGLTRSALALGSSEPNPVAAMGFGSSMLLKGLISSAIAMALLLFKRGRLLKTLDLGMFLIVLWNGFAIWSWGAL
jgi:hypothetical protein